MNRAFSAGWDLWPSIPGLSPWAGMGDAVGVGAIAATPKASRLQPKNSVLHPYSCADARSACIPEYHVATVVTLAFPIPLGFGFD